MSKYVSDFDVMKAIAKGSGLIWSAGGENIHSSRRTTQGWKVTLGINHECGDRLLLNETALCAFYVVDDKEFARVKAELEGLE